MSREQTLSAATPSMGNWVKRFQQNTLGVLSAVGCVIIVVLTLNAPAPNASDPLVMYWIATVVVCLGAGLVVVMTVLSVMGKRSLTPAYSMIYSAVIALVLASYAIAFHIQSEYFRYESLLWLLPIAIVGSAQAGLWANGSSQTSEQIKTRQRALWLVPIILPSILIFIATTIWFVRTLHFEDTFITFRYGWNLATGRGINWNSNDPVPAEGYTTFIWVLLSAAFFALKLDPLIGTQITSLLSLLVLAYLVWRLAQSIYRLDKWAALVPVAFLIIVPPTAFHIATGMETMFYTATVAGMSLLAVKSLEDDLQNVKWLALLGFSILLSGLSRPEGVAYGFVLLFLLGFWGKGKFFRRGNLFVLLATLVMPGMIYFAWRLIYFRELLPLSFYHKFLAGDLYGEVTRSVLFPDFVGMIVLPFAVLILYRIFRRSFPRSGYLLLIPSIVLVIYYSRVLAVAGLEYRFFYPYLFPFIVSASADLVNFFDWIASRLNRFFLPVVATIVFLYLCLGPFYYDIRNVVMFLPTGAFTYNDQTDEYMRIGRALLNIDKSEPIGTGEVGKIGMLLRDYTVVDIVGLNDSYLARHPFSTDYLDQRGVKVFMTFAYPGAPLGVYADVYRKVGEAFPEIESKFSCIGNIRGFDIFVRNLTDTMPAEFAKTLSQSRDFSEGVCLSKTTARWSPKSLALNLQDWTLSDLQLDGDTYRVTGNDPILLSPVLNIDSGSYNNVIVRATIPPKVECHTFVLYFTRADALQESEERSIYVPFDPSPEPQNIIFNVRRHPEWHGQIARLRLDPVCGLNSDGTEIKFKIDQVTLQ